MKIAVIDTGVETTHEAVQNCKHLSGFTVMELNEGVFDVIIDEFQDEIGHGTAVLGIICEHIADFEAVIIKLKDRNGKFTEELLCEGMALALSIAEVKVINISMGVVTDAPSLRMIELCKEAAQKDVIIVASAYSDSNKPCYPAYAENVFGVGKGYFLNQTFFQYKPENRINILAKGTHQKVAALNNGYTFLNGTSYATAHFTGILCKFLKQSGTSSNNQIIDFIEKNSVKPLIEVPLNYTKAEEVLSQAQRQNQEFSFYATLESCINKVALFPYNSSQLLDISKNKELFDKEIVFGIDFPNCAKVNTDRSVPVIERIPQENELQLFDSIIISNITDGYGLDDFKFQMLKQFVVHNKNIITWDFPTYSIINQIIEQNSFNYLGKIYFPYYSEEFMKEYHLSLSLPPSEETPSIPLVKMDTGEAGFRYQYILSNILEKYSYCVSNILTEPQGILSNKIDIVFPYSTKRMVDLEWEKWGVFLKLAKRLIAYRKQPDVFLTSVGNLLNYKNREMLDESLENEPLKNTIFLKGIQPDAYVGIIEADSNITNVSKTYNFIENMLGIEPMFFITTDSSFAQQNTHLKLPNKRKYSVVNIKDENMIIKMIEKRYANQTV